LRSEALGERGEARDVREQDGDLTGLTRATIGLCAEARAALTAEREAGRHLGATAGAARGELDAALTAEPHAGRVAVAAGSAQQGSERVVRSGRRTGVVAGAGLRAQQEQPGNEREQREDPKPESEAVREHAQLGSDRPAIRRRSRILRE